MSVYIKRLKTGIKFFDMKERGNYRVITYDDGKLTHHTAIGCTLAEVEEKYKK